MAGFSLTEMLVVLFLLSLSITISLSAFTRFYTLHEVKAFQIQLDTALKLAQGLSLMRTEDLKICAQKNGSCQQDWQGNLVVFANNPHTPLHNFGRIPTSLNIVYHSRNPSTEVLIQHQGLSINNGTFNIGIAGSTAYLYRITISEQGITTLK